MSAATKVHLMAANVKGGCFRRDIAAQDYRV